MCPFCIARSILVIRGFIGVYQDFKQIKKELQQRK